MPRTRRPQPVHFYPRPPRGGRRVFLDEDQSDILISIHALREEGDRVRFLRSSQRHNFYPRPPRGGRRPASSSLLFRILFLSTPSARRATSAEAAANRAWQISIHALREEGDSGTVANYSKTKAISIHALREEGDFAFLALAGFVLDFYPRPPRGGRLPTNALIVRVCIFLSTPSARRATFLGFLFALQSGNFYPRPPRGGRRMLH